MFEGFDWWMVNGAAIFRFVKMVKIFDFWNFFREKEWREVIKNLKLCEFVIVYVSMDSLWIDRECVC